MRFEISDLKPFFIRSLAHLRSLCRRSLRLCGECASLRPGCSVSLSRKSFAGREGFFFAKSSRSSRLRGESWAGLSPRRREAREENAKDFSLVAAGLLCVHLWFHSVQTKILVAGTERGSWQCPNHLEAKTGRPLPRWAKCRSRFRASSDPSRASATARRRCSS